MYNIIQAAHAFKTSDKELFPIDTNMGYLRPLKDSSRPKTYFWAEFLLADALCWGADAWYQKYKNETKSNYKKFAELLTIIWKLTGNTSNSRDHHLNDAVKKIYSDAYTFAEKHFNKKEYQYITDLRRQCS